MLTSAIKERLETTPRIFLNRFIGVKIGSRTIVVIDEKRIRVFGGFSGKNGFIGNIGGNIDKLIPNLTGLTNVDVSGKNQNNPQSKNTPPATPSLHFGGEG